MSPGNGSRTRHKGTTAVILVLIAVTGCGVPFAAPAPPPQTLTYVVTGSPADVTYGPAGSDLTGSVPMQLTKPLGSPVYYAVTAQLQGNGTVYCEIDVDGTAVSHAIASGGYQVARCEIIQAAGGWANANGAS
jgi:hypothetical protein